MKLRNSFLLLCLSPLLFLNTSFAQESLYPLKYGDMESWLTRGIEESFVIGGGTKKIYELEQHREMKPNTPFIPETTIWATSSVYARVSGINKGSVTVFPEEREGEGMVARLETRLETVKVLGVINIDVIATGTIFLGETLEPIRDTKNPQSKLITGIPFTGHPKALMFDYKVDPAGERIYSSGFGRKRVVEGLNAAEASIILQRRWEDENGVVYAKRVATGWHRFDKVERDWQDNFRVELRYGDISKSGDFMAYEDMMVGDRQIYTKNSKGEVTPVIEVGWDEPSAEVTHLIVRFSSGYGGAYIGSVGSKFWIDNVNLVY